MFITVFKKACHWTLSLDNWIQSTPSQLFCLRSSLILSSHLRIGLPSDPFLSGFRIKFCINFLSSHAFSTSPFPILPDFIVIMLIDEECKFWSSSLFIFLHPPVTSYPLGPDILLNTLFLDTLNLCSSLRLRAHVTHQYKTARKIIVLHILIFRFLDRRQNTLNRMIASILIFSVSFWIQFWFFTVIPKCVNFATFYNNLSTIFILWFCPAC